MQSWQDKLRVQVNTKACGGVGAHIGSVLSNGTFHPGLTCGPRQCNLTWEATPENACRRAHVAGLVHLKGGTLYTVPSRSPKLYRAEMRGPKLRATIATPKAARPKHRPQASPGESSPGGGQHGNHCSCAKDAWSGCSCNLHYFKVYLRVL